jgi:hypothetical protein
MKKNLLAAVLITAMSCILKTGLLAQNVPYKIDSVKAFMFYNSGNAGSGINRAGTFSENILDKEGRSLWNTPIGGGIAEGPSEQTMVVVQVKGNPVHYTERVVRLTVYRQNRQVFQQSQEFSILDDRSEYRAAFLICNTGCDELKLKAEIIHIYSGNGKKIHKTESSVTKELLFHCGE